MQDKIDGADSFLSSIYNSTSDRDGDNNNNDDREGSSPFVVMILVVGIAILVGMAVTGPSRHSGYWHVRVVSTYLGNSRPDKGNEPVRIGKV